MSSQKETVIVRWMGQQDYLPTWQAMQHFTQQREDHTMDEMWLLEHPPIFTQGQNGKPEHILNAGDIPVIRVDRGGQVTYHGPGQLMAYVLIDLRRKKWNVRTIVSLLENSVIELLAHYQLQAIAKATAPGVYLAEKKISSVGLRIRRGCSYHGLALNVKMDLSPFTRINPCGFHQLAMTQLYDYVPDITINTIIPLLTDYLIKNLGYSHYTSLS